MAYQFFHIETYSERPNRVRGTTDQYNSAEQVLEEVRRTAAYSEHVAEPMPPRQIGGTLTIDDFIARRAKLLAGIRETVTLKDGTSYVRKLREDAATLYTEIHSHPIKVSDFLADPDRHKDEISEWLVRVKDDFRKRMPAGIEFTAVMHWDESNLHVHILAINIGDPKLDANKLHAGKAAAAAYREAHDSDAITSLPKPELEERPKKPKNPKPSKNRVTQKKNDLRYAGEIAAWEEKCAEVDAKNNILSKIWKEKNQAHLDIERKARGRPAAQKTYDAAMVKLQDDYYEAVGKPCGLLRIGPRLARKPAKIYAAEKGQAKRMAEQEADLKQRIETQAEAERDLDDHAAALDARDAVLASDRAVLDAREAAHDIEVHNSYTALQAEQIALARSRADMEKEHAARADRLDEKEFELQTRESELTDAVGAMSRILDAVEDGDVEVIDGALHLPDPLPILDRLSEQTDSDAEASPVLGLLRRFVQLLVRVKQGIIGREATDLGRDDGPE